MAQSVYTDVIQAKNASEKAKGTLEELEGQIKEFLDTLGATPKDIRTLAEDVRVLFESFI